MKKYVLPAIIALMITVASAMQINGPLIGASLEKLASAPSQPVLGRIYYDTVNSTPKVCDGATCTTFVTAAQMIATLGYTPEDVANKSTAQLLGSSDTLYPTQHAVKVYVDTGYAAKEDLVNKSTNTSLGTSNTLYPTQNAVKTYVDGHAGSLPLTTLGDTLSEDSTPVPVRVAGNITTTKKFYTQTGTGSVSALPTWAAILAGDVPTLNQNTSGSAASLSQSITSGLPVVGNGSGIVAGTKSGNTTNFATTTGSLTNGDCVKLDVNGNFVDAGAACGAGAGSVSSVGLSDGSSSPIYTISNSPVTTTGTLTFTLNTQTTNKVFAAPNGSTGQPGFRALVGADLPIPGLTTLGGIQAITSVTHNWIRSISTLGVANLSQPDFSDLSGTAAVAQVKVVSGSRAGANAISGGGVIAATAAIPFQDIYVTGFGAAVTATIGAGTVDGQVMNIIGRSDTNTVTILNGSGASLNGTAILAADNILTLRWDTSNWVEISRNF